MEGIKHKETYKVIHPVPMSRAEEVMELFRSAWWANDRDLSFTKRVMAGSAHTWGLTHHGTKTLVGFTRVVSDGIAKATIYDVIIRADIQGEGIGSFFLDQILRSEALSNIQHVELYCKEVMFPFYGKLGFKDITDEVHLLRKVK